MSRRHYPRLGERCGVYPKPTPCRVCGGTERVYRQAVQVNWFRGDDDVHPVCRECKRLPEAELLTRLGYRMTTPTPADRPSQAPAAPKER